MIKKYCFVVALFCFGFGCKSVNAQSESEQELQRCSESIVNLVGKHFAVNDFSYPEGSKYPSAENGGIIIAGVCKVWPNDNSKTIAIFAYDAGVEYEKQLIIALVDTLTSKVVAAYKGAIQEDAATTVGSDSFNIDTARYNLSPGVRAFGLDVTTSYSQGCVDGGVGPMLTLYVQEGKLIRPILEDFFISTWSFANQGGRPNCMNGAGDELTEDISYSIGVGNATTNGFSNLLITATSSYSNGEKSTRKPFHYELHYDGKRYPTGIFNGVDAELEKELENWQRKLP